MEFLSLHHCVQTGSGAHPAFFCPVGTVDLSPGTKRPVGEANNSHLKQSLNNIYLHSPIRLHGMVITLYLYPLNTKEMTTYKFFTRFGNSVSWNIYV
jgi:hypothetical protein